MPRTFQASKGRIVLAICLLSAGVLAWWSLSGREQMDMRATQSEETLRQEELRRDFPQTSQSANPPTGRRGGN